MVVQDKLILFIKFVWLYLISEMNANLFYDKKRDAGVPRFVNLNNNTRLSFFLIFLIIAETNEI